MYGRYPSLLPAMLILSGASVWGLLWLPLRYMEDHGLNDAWAVLAVFIWPALIALPLTWIRRKSLRGYGWQCLLFGLMSGMGFGLYTLGLIYSSVIRVTLLFYLTPVWSALFAMLILKEHTRWQGWLAALTGLAGLTLMVGSGGEQSMPLNKGDIFGLASGILWAFGVIVLRKHPETPPIGTVTGQFFFASVLAGSVCILFAQDTGIPTLNDWLLGAAVLGLFSSAILLPSLFGVFWAAGRLPPSRVGILMMSEVLVAVVSASLLTNEILGTLEWCGALLIMGAALLEVFAGDEAVHAATD